MDAGLAAAFGPSSPDPSRDHSVLETVARLTGRAPRVLLRDDSSPGAASPVIDASARRDLPLPAGRGNYQLLGEIARGGMGTVVKGHDLDLGRDVALKVLHEKLASDPATLQRFVEEAQIGGQLQHPGIVPVYELGLMADDRPYFTMKLVKGRTLAALLKSRKSVDQDRHRFLTIFEQICQTLAYAHSKGVLHRDLKPANVMVGAFGEVQVVDWGLAKVLGTGAHDDSELAEGESQVSVVETVRSGDTDGSASQAGSVLGTPAYMPPEQAQGNVDQLDERTDVFALGGLLAEILTGKPPYPGQRQVAMTMAARANQVELLERLENCDANAELVELARDCLTPAAAARPADAGEVSDRIHAHLAALENRSREAQVEAAEARVRVTEERRRRRLSLTLAVVLLTLVVGGGGGWVALSQQRQRAENDRAERLLAMESQVEEARREARVAAAMLDWPASIAHLERGLALAPPGEDGEQLTNELEREIEGARGEARAIQERTTLERKNAELLAALEHVVQPWGTPALERNFAQEDQTLGATLWDFEIVPDSEDPQTAAAQIRARGPAMAVELSAVLEQWARVRAQLGNLDSAAELLRIADLVDPDEKRVELRGAIRTRNVGAMRSAAEQRGLAGLPTRTIALLAQGLSSQNSREEAVEVLRFGLSQAPESLALHMGLQKILPNMKPPRYQEALEHLEAARALQPTSAGVWARMGWVLRSLGRDEEAVPVLRTTLELGGDWHWVYSNLGVSLINLGLFEEAVDRCRESTRLAPGDWKKHNNLGVAFEGAGRLDEALESYERAIKISPGSMLALENANILLAKLNRPNEAIEGTRRMLKIDPERPASLNMLAWMLATEEPVELRDPMEAVRLARLATELDAKQDIYWGTLGTALYRTGEMTEAIQALERATRISESEGRRPYLENAFVLAMAHHREGHGDEARRWYDRGLSWIDPGARLTPDVVRLRDEAATVLGIEEERDD